MLSLNILKDPMLRKYEVSEIGENYKWQNRRDVKIRAGQSDSINTKNRGCKEKQKHDFKIPTSCVGPLYP